MKKTILKFFFGFYALLALLHMGHNLQALFTEESRFLFLTQQERKQIAYGNLLTTSRMLQAEVPDGESILMHTDDGKAYFYLRYFMYPRLLFWVDHASIEGNVSNYELYYGRIPTAVSGDILLETKEMLLVKTD